MFKRIRVYLSNLKGKVYIWLIKIGIMKITVYTLKKKNTNEYHLFRATPQPDNKCLPENNSICKEMKNSDSIEIFFACKTEDEARIECAKIGRDVCGTCVSDLYLTPKK